MHTVCELPSFMRAASEAGMTAEEVRLLIDFLAANPLAGDAIKGTGGCRKVRWRARDKGKSGGYRSITFYSGVEMPVFLLTVFGKSERADLSQAERNALAVQTKAIAAEYKKRVVKVSNAR